MRIGSQCKHDFDTIPPSFCYKVMKYRLSKISVGYLCKFINSSRRAHFQKQARSFGCSRIRVDHYVKDRHGIVVSFDVLA